MTAGFNVLFQDADLEYSPEEYVKLLRPVFQFDADLVMSSRFVAPFLEQTKKWEGLMSTISETIDVWMKVQAKWQYLEAIFIGSEDIRLQLPEEAKRFDRIQGVFKKIMGDTAKNPNVLDACSAEGRQTTLQGHSAY